MNRTTLLSCALALAASTFAAPSIAADRLADPSPGIPAIQDIAGLNEIILWAPTAVAVNEATGGEPATIDLGVYDLAVNIGSDPGYERVPLGSLSDDSLAQTMGFDDDDGMMIDLTATLLGDTTMDNKYVEILTAALDELGGFSAMGLDTASDVGAFGTTLAMVLDDNVYVPLGADTQATGLPVADTTASAGELTITTIAAAYTIGSPTVAGNSVTVTTHGSTFST